MNKISDELINKYVDKELSEEELDQLKILLENDPSLKEKLKAHTIIDEVLHKMENRSAPSNIASNVMTQISVSTKLAKENHYFFYGVVGLFSSAIIGLLIYIISTFEGSNNEKFFEINFSLVEKLQDYSTSNISIISNLLKSDTVMIIGLSLIFILIISSAFLFNNLRDIKEGLSKL